MVNLLPYATRAVQESSMLISLVQIRRNAHYQTGEMLRSYLAFLLCEHCVCG